MKKVEINGLQITMERRNIKNMNLYVKPPEGSILVTVPIRMPEEKVMEFLHSKEEWIRKAQKKIRERNENSDTQETLTFTPEERYLLQKNILYWAALWEPRLGVHAVKWKIREMKTRWGSCNVDTGSICINLRLARKAEESLEYVVVHELCHLLEPSHNGRFYGLMDHYMPDWRERKKRLNA